MKIYLQSLALLFLLGIHSTLIAAAPSFVLDLLTTPPAPNVMTRVYGRGLDNDGNNGVPVAGGYDCDGDGHLDYGFSQMQGDPFGRTGAGEVTLVFGDGTFGASIDSAVLQSSVLLIAGSQNFEAAGDEIWMDDVDGDGLGDLLIGRQNFSPTEDRLGAGALTIIFGSAQLKTHTDSLTYLDLDSPPAGIKIITVWGASEYDRLGIWMRTGDITGDGVADILVGADEVDGDGLSVSDNRGAVYIIRGGTFLKSAPENIDLANFGTVDFPSVLNGHVAQVDPPTDSADYHLGATVQLADLDGNNRMEVLASATLRRAGASLRLPGAPNNTGERAGGSTDGTLFIIWDENFPPWLWPNGYRFSAESPPLGNFTRIDGDPIYTNFGEEVIGGLDYSGDGLSELFIGDLIASPDGRSLAGIGYVIYNSANLRGLSFRIDTPPSDIFISTIYGPKANAIGADTVAQGDFDGDGIGDLAFGNPGDTPDSRSKAGTVNILYGQPGGWPTLIDLRPDSIGPTEVFPIPDVMRIAEIRGGKGSTGSNIGDTLCYSGSAADIDKDGLTDLIINEMVGDGVATPDVGNLIIISGAAMLSKPSFNLSSSATSPVNFGSRDIDEGAGNEQTMSFSNANANNLTILSKIIEGPNADDFNIFIESSGTVLSHQQIKTLSINFNPTTVGFKSAAVVIKTDLDSIPFRIALVGVGIDSNVTVKQLSIDRFETDITLLFDSDVSAKYLLQKSDDLISWNTENLRLGTGLQMNIFDPKAVEDSVSKAFFRLLIVP